VHRPQAASGEAGFALLVAILFLLLVTAVIAPFVLVARTGFDLAADGQRKARLDLLADGLLTVLARDLAAPRSRTTATASMRSEPGICRAGGLAVEARVQDQRGLVDLNGADEALLAAGFAAIGLEVSAAERYARAAAAYREPAETAEAMIGPMPAEALEFDPPDESLVADGFKRAPFEAVEELYDFRALQGMPLRRLVETFTLRGGGEVVAKFAPEPLAAALPPPEPGAEADAEAVEEEAAGPLRIDVFLRDGDGTLGYAGATVVPAGDDSGSFTVAERATNPNVMPGGGGGSGTESPCERIFGAVAAAVLRETG
jgi:general secretion pathway protein K